MKRYIIKNVDEKFYNAASKARRDVDTIAREYGYEPISFSDIVTADHALLTQIKMAIFCLFNGAKLAINVEKNSIVLLQYPQFPIKASYFLRVLIPIVRKVKGIRFAALVHDLDSLRGLCGRTGIYCDRKVLPLMDVIICHNEAMKQYLVRKGISEEKLVVLELFDYLTEAENTEHKLKDGIAIAGNLDPEKSSYIDGVVDATVHLYGRGRENFPVSAIYHGAYPPEELPGIIKGAFGLVWDGNRTDGCEGDAGRYLRFNNPHKLSLYLASGMPVITWKKAAVAKFVEENGVGFTVDRLEEIPEVIDKITSEDYTRMYENVIAVSIKVREGYFLITALKEVDQKLKMT